MIFKIIPFALLFFAACSRAPDPASETRKPLVLVSVAPYKFLAERIGGGAIEVQTIIPPRSNPHAFEPTSRQVTDIARGEVWFRIGEPFEEKVLPLLLGKSPKMAVSDLRERVKLHPAEEGHHCPSCGHDHLDRHIWLSPKLAMAQAKQMAEVLSGRFPELKDRFEENLEKCLSELQQLDLEIQAILAPLQERSFIVSHSAFGYFCREYGLEQLSVEQEGKDPRPRHLEEMLEKAKKAHAAVAFALPQHNNKGAQIVAKEINVPVRMIDPYSSDYIETLRNLARLIADPHREVSRP
jgi:zinc transport system substrate-binding protein